MAGKLDQTIEILIQVNVAGEKQKGGVAPAAVAHLLEQIDTMIGLRPRGMCAWAPPPMTLRWSGRNFERTAEIFEDLRSKGCGGERFNILSMGMTQDFEVAIECGANMVRVGSAIFAPGGG